VLTSHWPGLNTEFMAMLTSPVWDELELTYLKDVGSLAVFSCGELTRD